ncbi:PadR family transcriptional regulator [Kineosporia sp. R_H_3]|uniref:PadR family transcriptional regulator n=1 Tax=Kineosporia sp. R_H_3 TaxID=1961848 RepID=UPI000B4A6B49|nr:PadR family transcriptional regulator [Kineosporia sp. R_H_3]
MSDVTKGFPGPLLHGFLDLCLLGLLVAERDYGYGLGQRLGAAGFGEVPGGTLYPALLRLERGGLVEVAWEASDSGPRRKYYAVTPAGREAFQEQADRWAAFSRSVDTVVAQAVPAAPGRSA